MLACRELVAEQRAAGQDVELTTYPGAHHSFDNVGRSAATAAVDRDYRGLT